MSPITLTFEFEKETKNAVRFQEVLEEDQERGVVGTLYVLKSALPDPHPSRLQVEITTLPKTKK